MAPVRDGSRDGCRQNNSCSLQPRGKNAARRGWASHKLSWQNIYRLRSIRLALLLSALPAARHVKQSLLFDEHFLPEPKHSERFTW